MNLILENLVKSLSDTDPQKSLLTLATKLAELQEQNRLIQSKINESEKRSTGLIRDRDQILFENSRSLTAKTKLESLCRELHQHNQQIRVKIINIYEFFQICIKIIFIFKDESIRKQQDDESKRQELANKFQVFFLLIELFSKINQFILDNN